MRARVGAGVARSGTGAIDQGLRAYMLGVYNYMRLGSVDGARGSTALYMAALPVFAGAITVSVTPFGQLIYFSPLRWLVIFAPLGLVLFGLSAGR